MHITGNYRPVSLTSIVCKVLEKIIRNFVMTFLEENNLLTSEQHGFVSKKSCATNLLESLDLVSEILAEGNPVDIVYLDFAKAFDMVPHKRLLHKLNAYGIGSVLLKWFESFLTGRKQRVVLGDSISDWSHVTSGVPQGSVIGPLLFVIFINDLPEKLTNKCKLFADDSKIIARVGNEENEISLQKDINSVTDWTKEWLMKLNAKKCKVMHLGRRNNELGKKYLIEDVSSGIIGELSETLKERDLGIIFSSDLTWTAHVQAVASKANRILGQLKNTFVSRDLELWKKLYVSMVRPHLEFAVSAWSPYLKKDISELEKVQKRALKIPNELKGLHSYEKRLERIGLTSLEERRKRGDVIQFFKFQNGLEIIDRNCFPKTAPSRILIGPAGATRGNSMKLVRETFAARSRNDFAHFTTVRDNFFSNRVVEIWNELPDSVIKAPSLNSFKAKLDNFMSR